MWPLIGSLAIGTAKHMMNFCGDKLGELLVAGTRSAVIAAPFIKEEALRRLVAHLSDDVVLQVVTRWRPEEVARKVSDLSVLDVVLERPLSCLLLHPTLHAKYFRSDNRCLVGSANVTASALGWRLPANEELLVEPNGGLGELRGWETQLLAESIPATVALRQEVQRLAQLIPVAPVLPAWLRDPFVVVPEPHQPSKCNIATSMWVPQTRQPELLWLQYLGSWDALTTSQRQSLRRDFQYLMAPPGLDESSFRTHVRAALGSSRVVMELRAILESGPSRFGATRSWMATFLASAGIHQDATVATQNIYRWLLFYFPDQFRTIDSKHSEVLAIRA